MQFLLTKSHTMRVGSISNTWEVICLLDFSFFFFFFLIFLWSSRVACQQYDLFLALLIKENVSKISGHKLKCYFHKHRSFLSMEVYFYMCCVYVCSLTCMCEWTGNQAYIPISTLNFEFTELLDCYSITAIKNIVVFNHFKLQLYMCDDMEILNSI